MKKYNTILSIIALLLSNIVISQDFKKNLREGNKEYAQGNYKTAEKLYQKGELNSEFGFTSKFNKGDALFRQKNYAKARVEFLEAAKLAGSKEEASKALHNAGNTLLSEQNYQDAVKVYSNALRLNPKDEQSRYNLAYSLEMMRQNAPKPKEQQQNQAPQQEEEKKEDKDSKQEEQKKEQNQQKQQQSKQKAENMLDALEQKEKDIQKKVKDNKGKSANFKIEKDW